VSFALVVAVKGFSDPRWQVRNSCMTQVLQRALGNKRVGYTDESAAQNKVTAQQFFACYPILHPFLLGTVEDLLLPATTGGGEHECELSEAETSAGGTGECRSCSEIGGCPVLLLLSRLRPADFAAHRCCRE
jgi:hypothetical protein